MQHATLFALLLLAPQGTSPRTDRPSVPYSLPPLSASAPEGQVGMQPMVPAGAPAPTPRPVAGLDDAVPLPVPAVREARPGGDVVVQPASGDPFFLGFAAGEYRPDGLEAVDPGLFDVAFDDGRPAQETYAFVMFSKRMTSERLAQLEGLGCRPLGFHPHYTQRVALPLAAVDAVAALPFVRWVGAPRAWQKLQPELEARAAAAPPNQPLDVWINVYESDVGPASVRRALPAPTVADPSGNRTAGEVRELQDVWITRGWMHAALEGAGLEVVDFSDRIHAFRARMMPQGVDLVTALDFVQFVELDSVGQLDHEESMTMINADFVRYSYDGGTNTVAIGGMADGGVEIMHLDVNPSIVGWDISGDPTPNPYEDTCGHGTHVAGTILGQGVVDPDNTGAAPGLGWGGTGMFQHVRIFEDCDPQPVDDAAVLGILASAYTGAGGTSPRPHVHNHSWGSGAGSAWLGTEAEPRLWDDHVYDDAQLPVHSAGNGGPAFLSVGKEGSAKNVLAVGSVDDWDWTGVKQTGIVSPFSSRGPTADGRWKPNVVAPGSWITSADAFDVGGYTQKEGTSMAAPHVTGLAAALVDKESSSFAYLPERISAQLMATAHRKNGEVISSALTTHLSEYGAGRVDGMQALWSTANSTWTSWAFALPATWSNSGDFWVPAGATRLVVVAHYVEEAASAGASKALVNDWDLWIDAPPILSTASASGEYSSHQSPNDNTELRVIANPAAGLWRWKVHPKSTPAQAYFGVTAYVQVGNPIPPIAPSLSIPTPWVQPNDVVWIEYAVPGSQVPLSSVFIESSVDGPNNYLSARAFHTPSHWADMLSNIYNGTAMTLGNTNWNFPWRKARWEYSWPFDGLYDISVSAWADNASNSGHTETVTIAVDGTPPGVVTNIQSTSHTVFAFSCNPTFTVTWDPVVDPVSGVDGYSYVLSETPSEDPPPYAMTFGTTATVTIPSTGGPAWYFNVRAIDNSGNAGQPGAAGPYFIDDDPVSTYCLPKTNSQGCIPKIEGGGTPSLEGGFQVIATNVLNNKSGLLFWGRTVSGNPFQGGYKCVANPVQRTPVQSAGGNPPPDDCSGKYVFEFDRYYINAKGIVAGEVLYAQYWSRDPAASYTTGLTDGLQFQFCP